MDTITAWLQEQQTAFAAKIKDFHQHANALQKKEAELKLHAEKLNNQEKELEQFRRVSFISSMNKQMQKKDVRIRMLEKKIRKLEATVSRQTKQLHSFKESKSHISDEQVCDLIVEDIQSLTESEGIEKHPGKSPSPESVPSEQDETLEVGSCSPHTSPVLTRGKTLLYENGSDSHGPPCEDMESFNEQSRTTTTLNTDSKLSGSDFEHEHKFVQAPSEVSENKISDSDDDLYISPSESTPNGSPLLREFQKRVRRVMYVFRELKTNKGKIYKVRDDGTVHKRRSGTFKVKADGEIIVKWA